MLSSCDLVCQRSKCIECDNKIFNLICILKREAVLNEKEAGWGGAEGEAFAPGELRQNALAIKSTNL